MPSSKTRKPPKTTPPIPLSPVSPELTPDPIRPTAEALSTLSLADVLKTLGLDHASVRVVCDESIIAEHPRCWDRRRAIEHPDHIKAMLDRRPGARGPKRRDRLASLSTQCRLYLSEIARRRINLDSEVRKLDRLVTRYGEADVVEAMAKALGARTFGARYVRALIDQGRFARGLGEPPEPIVTGRADADALDVTPHDLETYDALFDDQRKQNPSVPISDPPDDDTDQ